MEYRYSEKVRKEISLLGFGGWQLGNKTFWGEMSEEEGIQLVQDAVEQGVNFFDTAPGYSNGTSERIIGEGVKKKRDKVFINTKFGHHADGSSDFNPDIMESAIKESASRMQTDYVDSVILHNPSFDILEGKTTHFQVLKELKKTGLIRAYGVSIDTKEELKATLDNLDVDVIEIMFNIIHQEVTTYFDEVKKRGILLIIKVPLDSGWLTGKYHKDTVFQGIRDRWTKEVKETRYHIVERIRSITNETNLVPVALGFIASFGAVITIIPGAKNVKQLQENKKAVKYKLSPEVKDALVQLYDNEISKMNTPW